MTVKRGKLTSKDGLIKVKHSFGTYWNPMFDENILDTEEVAHQLAKNWGDIPKYVGNLKAFELFTLAQAYLRLLKESQKKE